MYKIYQVQNGDTLLLIASRLGIDVELLATLNGLNVNSELIPNSYIVIPGGSTYFDSYTVKKGDNMYEIANKYNVNTEQLLLLNGLNRNDYIYPDQKIMIPSANSGFYITKEGDTLQFVQNALKLPIEQLVSQNGTLFLAPDQLIVYKK